MGRAIIVILFMFVATMPSFGQSSQELVQVFIMRHAEKADDSKDPELSEAGKERAKMLSKLLSNVKVDRLYATPFIRTNQTLASLAASQHLAIEESPKDLVTFAKQLYSHNGETVVIAAHSNTAPQLVNLLIADKKYGPIEENDFGKIWHLTLQDGKALSCILLNTN